MSHFSVLVIGDNVEGQLAPYDENIVVEPYVEKTFEQAKIDRQNKIAMEKDILALPEEKKQGYNIPYVQSLLEKYENMTDEEFYNEYKNGYKDFNEKGEPLTTYNPKSKWDWYSIGGRWEGYLTLKDGTSVNSAKKSELLGLEGCIEKRKKELRENFEEAMNDVSVGNFTPDRVEFVYGIKYGETVDDFINRKIEEDKNRNPYSTFAIVKNGEWFEKGSMGWWATVSNENKDWYTVFNEVWNNISDDETVTIVDCHI